ncbi:GNAT family N-acetyltransferase [Propionibacterium freudenreichii]|uniref:GNAT family N-acetyltransferase n=1 Tax=Propionibacterium freudenreichii TaxID=1744 RepID=UPI0005A5CA00|nr:GNAT family N-acetyltransferase [Propionibacterium freudenreichii]MDK9348273.1 GNAT family N-acetyltransferase [Propionibacterium freudenreichii]MDK9627138.1 GNAT family N-acetyltransferase [Propionibacterium freudenreichii]MDK9652592.1 GNAT family N-acetyltransferase [Propionibacterium freudenreichii]CEI30833.1 Acetyltransferase [Propionibacterium freudenreichii]
MASAPGHVRVRPYMDSDAGITRSIFLQSVTLTAAEDYTKQQIDAWASPQDRPLDEWNRDRQESGTLVAVVAGVVMGFTDIRETGYIDMLFVSPKFVRRGIGSALLREAENRARIAKAPLLYSNASITARPFFAHHGFVEVAEQHPIIHGVQLKNYRMNKHLF